MRGLLHMAGAWGGRVPLALVLAVMVVVALVVSTVRGQAVFNGSVYSLSLFRQSTCVDLQVSRSLRCWGSNMHGQLGVGHVMDVGSLPGEMGDALKDVHLGPGRSVKLLPRSSAASESFCVVLDDESVKCWGRNMEGQLGQGDLEARGDNPNEMGINLTAIDLGSDVAAVRQITLGYRHVCVRFVDDRVKCWGDNAAGQLGYEDQTPRGTGNGLMGDALPYVDLGGGNITEMCSGSQHNCVLMNGSVRCWGFNDFGQLGYGDTNNRGDGPLEMGTALPVVDLGNGSTAVHIACGFDHTCAVLANASVKCWGINSDAQLGYGDIMSRGTNKGQMGASLPVVDIGTFRHSHRWDNSSEPALQLALGQGATCVLARLVRVIRCWGNGMDGILGDEVGAIRGDSPGEMGSELVDIDLGTGFDPQEIAVGYRHACAVSNATAEPALKCWGSGNAGELGNERMDNIGDHSNEMGNFLPKVDFGTVYIPAPTPAPWTKATATDVFVGKDLTCVLVEFLAEVRCFGGNQFGQLGLEHTSPRGTSPDDMSGNLTAVLLPTGRRVEQLATSDGAEAAHVCVVLDGGVDLLCWGHNTNGQLGLESGEIAIGDDVGEMGDALVPVNLGVPGLAIRQVAVGHSHTCVVFVNGSLKCFGDNTFGKLGLGEAVPSRGSSVGDMGSALPFVDVGGHVSQVFCGGDHTCVLVNATQVKCFGRNVQGTLGYGDGDDRGTAAIEMGSNLPVVALRGVPISVHAARYHTCARLQNSSIQCWGLNSFGQLGYEDTTTRGGGVGEMGTNLPFVKVLSQQEAGSLSALLSVNDTELIESMCTGGDSTCILLVDGQVKCWGDNTYGQLGFATDASPGHGANPGDMGAGLPFVHITPVGWITTLRCGTKHVCILLQDNTLKCWGDNSAGQLGLGSLAPFLGRSPWDLGRNHSRVNFGRFATLGLSTAPSPAPTTVPTAAPTPPPTSGPSPAPTTAAPLMPSMAPTAVSSTTPSRAPTQTSTSAPFTAVPSPAPNALPTSQPSPAPTLQPTPGPTMAPTESIATILADNEVPQVFAVVQGADTVYVRWPAQSDPRMTVIGYRVAMQTAKAGSFVTVSEPAQNWTTVTGLSPQTQYGFKVAVVATRGVGLLSHDTAQVTTWNDTVGVFGDTGVVVRVIASIPLPACDATVILNGSEDVAALFGTANPLCTQINQRTARFALASGATLAPGTQVGVWTNETFAFAPPSNPTPITPSLSSASHVSWCDSWTADASSSTGVGGSIYPLSYRWWLSSLDTGNAASVIVENARLSSLHSNTTRVLFNATRFVHSSVVTVHVTVSSAVFNLSASTEADTNISALSQPTVSIVGSANRTVLSFQDLAIRTTVSAPECFTGSANSSVFSWTAVQGVMPAPAITRTRTLFIPALSLDVTQTYIFRVRMSLDDFPMLSAVTADVQVSTLLTPPVVALAGGTQRTVGCEANTTLDASQSYDPNVCGALQQCHVLIFTWTCVGCKDAFDNDVENDAALLYFRACDLVNRTAAFLDEDATAVLQLDVAVYSTVSQLISSSGVETTVLAPEVAAPPVIVLDPIPGTVTPNDSITVCSGSNGTLDIADTETQTTSLQAAGSYFTLSTAALQPGIQYQLVLQDSATGVVVTTSVALNDPPSLGSFVVSPNTVAGGEAVLDVFELRSWGHIDDPAHMPLSMTFSWQDGSGYEAVLAENTAEFSLADVALPAGSFVIARAQVADRLGSSASLTSALSGELVVSVAGLPLSVDWSRPGAITSALLSWSAFSDGLFSAVLDSGEELSFEQLTLMLDLSPSTSRARRLLDLAPPAFAAIPVDELTHSVCADAQAIATLAGVNAIDTLLFLAQIADSGCGGSVFFASATASEQYVSFADISSTRFGLAKDTDVSSNGVTLQIAAAITRALASGAEFVDTRTSTVPESAAFDTANTQVLSPVHNLELRPSTLPCSDLCNDWEGQTNGTCTAQDLPANTSKLGEDAVTITIDVDADALDLDPVVDKCGNKVYPEVKCMHASLSDLVEAAGNDSANVTWSTEGCDVVERTKDSVTCACSHLTAFAVGAIVHPGAGECGETQCEELGGTWGEIYDSPGYAIWLSLLCCTWVFILVTDAKWFYDPDTEEQRSKFTTLVFISQMTVVLAVLRIAYYMLMLLAYGTAENGMACAEFGLKGSGSLVPPYALLAVHDIFYPVFLAMFASVFLYWLDLAEVIAVNLGKAKNLLFLRPETQRKVLVFNVFLILFTAGVNVYLVGFRGESRGASVVARAHLTVLAVVFLLESALYVYCRKQLEQHSEDKSTMKKIQMMSNVLCALFAGLGVQLLVLATTPSVQHAESAVVLYSVLLPVYELLMARYLYSTMHVRKSQAPNKDNAAVGAAVRPSASASSESVDTGSCSMGCLGLLNILWHGTVEVVDRRVVATPRSFHLSKAVATGPVGPSSGQSTSHPATDKANGQGMRPAEGAASGGHHSGIETPILPVVTTSGSGSSRSGESGLVALLPTQEPIREWSTGAAALIGRTQRAGSTRSPPAQPLSTTHAPLVLQTAGAGYRLRAESGDSQLSAGSPPRPRAPSHQFV